MVSENVSALTMNSHSPRRLSLIDAANTLVSFEDFVEATKEDRPIVPFPVPEWGKSILLRAMAQSDRDEWELRDQGDWNVEPDEKKRDERARKRTIREIATGIKAGLVARCIVNPDGARIFTNQQVQFLQQRNAAAIDRIAEKANELCGFSRADTAKLIEDAKKASDSHDDEQPSD